jgi:uncharacterized membrane protein YfcA
MGDGARFVRLVAMATYSVLLAIGLVAGVLGGMFGIGGGLLMVPALILIMKMGQLDAFGTSLAALVPPAGLLGAIEYYRNGNTNIRYALLLSAGLLVGAYLGARIVISLPPATARRAYGVFLLVVAVRSLVFGK